MFEKVRFKHDVFRPHGNSKRAFSNSSGLKRVFEKLRFRDGLLWTVSLTVEIKPDAFTNPSGVVWTVGLTVKIKLRFQIYPAWNTVDGVLISLLLLLHVHIYLFPN